jgi:hypothetical protein
MAELVIITLRNAKSGAKDNVAGFPLPADYLATFAIFGVLGSLPESASTFATVTGWGYVVATFLHFVDPTLQKTTVPGTATPSPSGPVGPAGPIAPAHTPSVSIAQ